MRRLLILLLASIIFGTVARAEGSRPPLSKAEILGRLAAGSSPSAIGHLVKVRGVSFTADSQFLQYVKDAGGDGILINDIDGVLPGDSDSLPANNDDLLLHIAKCAALENSGELRRAAKECKAATDANPKDPFALIALSRCASEGETEAGDPQALAQKALDLAPNLGEARDRSAEFSGGPEENFDSYEKAQQTDPDDLDSAFRTLGGPPQISGSRDYFVTDELASIPRQWVREDTAEQDRSTVDNASGAEESPDAIQDDLRSSASQANGTLPAQRPVPMFYDGDPEKSMERVRELLNAEPDFAPAHAVLAGLLITEGKAREALDEIRQATELEPGQLWFRTEFMELLRISNMKPEQIKTDLIEQATAATQIQPKNVELHSNLAQVLSEYQDLAGAMKEYQTCIGLQQDNQGCHAGIAEIEREQGKFDDVIGEFERYLSVIPFKRSGGDRIDYAGALESAGKLSEAAVQCEQAITIDPADAFAHHTLAGIRFQQRYFPDAVYEEREAIRLTGAYRADNPTYHLGLAYFLVADEKSNEALATYKDALKQWPDDAEIHNDLAWFYATSSDPQYRDIADALTEAKKTVELDQWQTAGFIDTLAEAEFQNHQIDAAIATETKALALDPKNEQLQHQLERFKKRDLSVPAATN